MTDVARDKAPTAEEIEQRFSSPLVKGLRPTLLAGLTVLKTVRRFSWHAQVECDFSQIDQPVIFAANHRSHADTAAILGVLPKHMRNRTAVAAALDVFGPDSNGGLKRKLSKDMLQLIVGSGFHAFAFDRFGPPLRSVRTSVQLIRNGWNLLLYPEGGRTRLPHIRPFKPGVSLLAKFSGAPVIPVFVHGGDAILPCEKFLPGPGVATVVFGGPLTYGEGETPNQFANRVEEQVRLLGARFPVPELAETRPWGWGTLADARY